MLPKICTAYSDSVPWIKSVSDQLCLAFARLSINRIIRVSLWTNVDENFGRNGMMTSNIRLRFGHYPGPNAEGIIVEMYRSELKVAWRRLRC